MGSGIHGHGMTEREQQIMDRIEAGMSVDQIALMMGVSRQYVDKTRVQYNGSWRQNDAFDAMVRRGSQDLAVAIAKTGGRFR